MSRIVNPVTAKEEIDNPFASIPVRVADSSTSPAPVGLKVQSNTVVPPDRIVESAGVGPLTSWMFAPPRVAII